MIFLCRAIPIKEDSRARRYIDLLNKNHIPHKVISWGSDNPSEISPRFIPRYRDKKLINLFLIILFNFWLFFYLLFQAKRDDVIFSIDLDTRFASFLLQIFRKILVIFDVADPFCLSRLNGKFPWINKFEGYLCNKSTLCIFPSKERSTLYKLSNPFLVIENVPDDLQAIKFIPVGIADDNLITLGYFGSLEPKYRLLESLVEVVVASTNFRLVVAGSGGLHSFFVDSSNRYPNKIQYFGKFDHSQLVNYSSMYHVTVAFYSLNKRHHAYVASNKQFEHLALAKPCLTNDMTSLANFIKIYNTGWIINEDELSEKSLNDLIKKEHYQDKVKNCDQLWKSYYGNYWDVNENVKQLISIIQNEGES